MFIFDNLLFYFCDVDKAGALAGHVSCLECVVTQVYGLLGAAHLNSVLETSLSNAITPFSDTANDIKYIRSYFLSDNIDQYVK